MTHPPYPYGPPPAWPPSWPPLGAPEPAQAPSPYAAWPGQPYPYPAQPSQGAEPMPDNGLALALCSLVLGFCSFFSLVPSAVAVFKANSVQRLWSAGQRDEARAAAKAARTWSLVAFGVTVLGCGCSGLGLMLLSATAHSG